MNEVKKKPSKNPGDHVIRVKQDTYALINKLRGKMTFDAFILNAVTCTEALATKEQVYIVGERAFKDLLDARGEALLTAARAKTAPVMPTVCIPMGVDNGQ